MIVNGGNHLGEEKENHVCTSFQLPRLVDEKKVVVMKNGQKINSYNSKTWIEFYGQNNRAGLTIRQTRQTVYGLQEKGAIEG